MRFSSGHDKLEAVPVGCSPPIGTQRPVDQPFFGGVAGQDLIRVS